MKLQSAFLATTVALVTALGACGSGTGTGGASGGSTAKSGGSSGNGGATGNGGNGGSGVALCTAGASVSACGGDVTGTWTVSSACLSVSGTMDVQTLFGLSCATGQVTGYRQVTGTWTANADGTFKDGTTTTGTEQLSLGSDCKILSKAVVTCDRLSTSMGSYYDTADCTDDTASGGCKCSATIKQTGSMGLLTTDPNTSGNYKTASNTITITQDDSSYSYCAASGKLTVTPKSTGITLTGTIVLQSGTPPGSGGASAGGGATGQGGSTGSGGANPSGGASATGGVKASGGAAGSTSQGGAGGVGPGTGGNTARDGGQDVAPGSGGAATGGATGAGGGGGGTTGQGPCDIYAAASMPCGAAYSMVRSLSSKYSGPLYQVRSGSSATNTGTGGATQDIGMLADGYADSAAQDTFCTGTTCTVSILYDQSGNKNDMVRGSKGPTGNGNRSGENDYEAVATKVSVTAGGHKVYGLYIQQYGGYRTALNVTGKGIPSGNKDQGIYELIDGTHFGGACCWDFGSVSPDPSKYVTMNTIFFGTGFWGKGAGAGPWFGGDFEGGVWMGGTASGDPGTPGSSANANNPTLKVSFALGILHTPVGKYSLRMADISTASDLTTGYDGNIPAGKTWGNAGGIVLGVGGDNSNNSEGTFFEGVVTNGAPSSATDLLILKNIKAVGYTK